MLLLRQRPNYKTNVHTSVVFEPRNVEAIVLYLRLPVYRPTDHFTISEGADQVRRGYKNQLKIVDGLYLIYKWRAPMLMWWSIKYLHHR